MGIPELLNSIKSEGVIDAQLAPNLDQPGHKKEDCQETGEEEDSGIRTNHTEAAKIFTDSGSPDCSRR